MVRVFNNKLKVVGVFYKGVKEVVLEYEFIGKSENYYLFVIKLLIGWYY